MVDANTAGFAAEVYKAYLIAACRVINRVLKNGSVRSPAQSAIDV
jgi:hypothetical protein